MNRLQQLCLCLALLAAPPGAAAQSDITIPTPDTLEFLVRMSIAPGTQQVYCYQQDQLRVVGTTSVTSGSKITVPVSLPDPVIRCAACNASGCSSLSSNAAVVVAADPLDFDLSGAIDVRDMLMCYAKVRDRIY
jgi:hypothetical protein